MRRSSAMFSPNRFGLVLGIARHADHDELKREGADRLITDPGDLL
jgi:hypothetical protein